MFIDLPPQQVTCVAQAIYGEARGESDLGKRAVAHVILNRAKTRKLTPCQVVNQRGQFLYSRRVTYSGADWNKALKIAKNPGSDPTYGAMYFHSKSVNPRWKLKLTVRIGNHLFYR
jgi:spore germination cell wall hydrolase CwlJ-like protein